MRTCLQPPAFRERVRPVALALAAMLEASGCVLRGAPVSATSSHAHSNPSLGLPPPAVRVAMVDALARTITRVDGDGLLARGQRGEPWSRTLERLRDEARAARDLLELGTVFRRLDASYPNLHAHVLLAPDLDREHAQGRVALPFRFRAERIDRDSTHIRFRLTRAEPDAAGAPGALVPARGDYVEAIDGVPIDAFARGALAFCKWPLAAQCAWDLFDSLRRERLGWDRTRALTLTLSREGGTPFTWTARARPPATAAPAAPQGAPDAALPCDVAPERYPGFALTYQGRHACVFTSSAHPGVAVLRIRSFRYGGGGTPAALEAEVEQLWAGYWREHARATRTLIIDLIENGGGQAPVPYYTLLLEAPFQEQYAQFRRLAEFDDPQLADALMWGSSGHRHWREALVRDGTWAHTPEGSFLPPVPQFCPDETRDCREGLFTPREHGFQGRVALLLDPLCVSSCAGFAWRVRTALGARVRTYGLPDSGDTTFSRIGIVLRPEPSAPDGVSVSTLPLDALDNGPPADAWVVQFASITRTVSADGAVLSATPQPIDTWVAPRWDLSDDEWERAVFEAALAGEDG